MTVPEKMSFACRWPGRKAIVTCELNPTVWAPATTAQTATAEHANNAAVTATLRDRFIDSASSAWSGYEMGGPAALFISPDKLPPPSCVAAVPCTFAGNDVIPHFLKH